MDILFTLNELGILRWIEDISICLAIAALYECIMYQIFGESRKP